jgi:hypothetical protein
MVAMLTCEGFARSVYENIATISRFIWDFLKISREEKCHTGSS